MFCCCFAYGNVLLHNPGWSHTWILSSLVSRELVLQECDTMFGLEGSFITPFYRLVNSARKIQSYHMATIPRRFCIFICIYACVCVWCLCDYCYMRVPTSYGMPEKVRGQPQVSTLLGQNLSCYFAAVWYTPRWPVSCLCLTSQHRNTWIIGTHHCAQTFTRIPGFQT